MATVDRDGFMEDYVLREVDSALNEAEMSMKRMRRWQVIASACLQAVRGEHKKACSCDRCVIIDKVVAQA